MEFRHEIWIRFIEWQHESTEGEIDSISMWNGHQMNFYWTPITAKTTPGCDKSSLYDCSVETDIGLWDFILHRTNWSKRSKKNEGVGWSYTSCPFRPIHSPISIGLIPQIHDSFCLSIIITNLNGFHWKTHFLSVAIHTMYIYNIWWESGMGIIAIFNIAAYACIWFWTQLDPRRQSSVSNYIWHCQLDISGAHITRMYYHCHCQ
jgi:hypothetical protein